MMPLEPIVADEHLIHRIIDGDERAFTELYQRYHQRLGAYLFKLTKAPELTQELVHDVFLKIWQNRVTLAPIKNFKAYLFVVSKNMAINHLKKLAKEFKEQQELIHLNEDSFDELTDEANRYILMLDEAVDRLPPQGKQVYMLCKQHRLSYAEIANQLAISPETVKKHLQRAVKSITEYLRSHADTAGIALLCFFYFFD
ncbi:RNA polymerase sigma-70 factor [Olivibacter ginsenosidimutans]|uniref:RNA polymerase sigma-70 factor n=1 Tax=Olivibacter ginsenosidimutans TaxID=1176537 RepID=A0ABP9BQ91_9SPHI